MRLTRLLKNLLHRTRVEQDLDDELRGFVEMAADERRRAGVPDAEARRAALVELQGLEQVKERVRDVSAGALSSNSPGIGCRPAHAGRNRGVTIAAVLTLALGIGATTAIFSIVDTIVFRPLPYGDADRLVKIWASGAAPTDNMALAEFEEMAEQRGVFESLAADDGMDFTVMTVDGGRESANGALVTAGWLNTLAVHPVLGRGFLPDEGQPGRGRWSS